MYRIKDLREENNQSQTEIAKILGLQQNSYSQIETGVNTLQVDHLIKLAQFYHTSTDYILGLTNEKNRIHKHLKIFFKFIYFFTNYFFLLSL